MATTSQGIQYPDGASLHPSQAWWDQLAQTTNAAINAARQAAISSAAAAAQSGDAATLTAAQDHADNAVQAARTALEASLATLSSAVAGIDSDLSGLESLTSSGRLSKAQLDTAYAARSALVALEELTATGRLSKDALKSTIEAEVPQALAKDTTIRDAAVAAVENVPNVVTSAGVRRIVAVANGDPLPPLTDGDLVVYYDAPITHLFTDFSEYDTGQAPHDWTDTWDPSTWTVVDAVGATGGKALRLSAVTGNRRAIVWDALLPDSERQQVEVVFRWRTTRPASTPRAAFEVAGDGTAETGYVTGVNNAALSGTRYIAGTLVTSNAEGGGFGSIPYGPAIVAGDWYWCRARMVRGATVAITHWKDGDTEPAPQHVNTNAIYAPHAGAVGIFNTAFTAGDQIDIDRVGISINDRPAPMEA